MSGVPAIVSIIAPFAVGALKSLIHGPFLVGVRIKMTIIGVIEAAVTYGLGLAFGAISQESATLTNRWF